MQPFHLAILVHDLASAEAFYGNQLGCAVGRRSSAWIDFNFFGHQLSVHLAPGYRASLIEHLVDDKMVPLGHFGVVLDWQVWHELSSSLEDADTHFIIAPYIRFAGHAGEQATLFFSDPSGNVLEFKSFKDRSNLFSGGADYVS